MDDKHYASAYLGRAHRQAARWVLGTRDHNSIDNECCPDFSCCMPDLFETDQAKRLAVLNEFERRNNLPTSTVQTLKGIES